MAEALFRYQAIDKGIVGYHASSAGVSASNGDPANEHAISALGELGIDLSGHQSQSLTPELVEQAELIVAMTQSHQLRILDLFPEANNRVFLMKSFGTSQGVVPAADVSDPYGGSLDIYPRRRDEIDLALLDLIHSFHSH